MKRILTIFLALACATSLHAQENVQFAVRDTLIYHELSQVDSTLTDSNVFGILPTCVTVRQSFPVKAALQEQIEKNESRMFTGFRIRIFSDGGQSARGASESAETKFHLMYPEYATYRTYDNPFFKVTIGNFRTRVEAEKMLRVIRRDFPSATIVKERFKYPSLDGGAQYEAESLTFLSEE